MPYKLSMTIALLLVSTSALAIKEFAVTREELVLLPSYCQAKYGKDRGNQAIQSNWSQIYGHQNWANMHHYCDALKSIVRANRTVGDKAELSFYLGQARQSIDHLLASEQTPDWILRPEAHVNLGKVSLRLARLGQGSEAQAVQNFEKAISIQPDYEPAYSALSDYYSEKGVKGKALNVIEEGLRHSPDSKALLRRFKALGGKIPPPPIVAAPQSNVAKEPSKAAVEPQQSAGQANGEKQAPADAVEPPKIGSPKNPYCRFCPD